MGEILGIFRARPEDGNEDAMLSQILLAGAQNWADSEVVRSVRQASITEGENLFLEDCELGESTSWLASLRASVESAQIVHLNLEQNGVFLAGPEEDPIVTP